MQAPSERHFIHGAIFLLANRMQALENRVTGEVTSKQWFVLLAVRQLGGAPPLSRVAREVGSTRQNTTKLLEQLAQKGFVELMDSEDDLRSRVVRLTPKAEEEMAVISKAGGQFVERLFCGIPQPDIEAAVRVLQGLFANLDEIQNETPSGHGIEPDTAKEKR